MYAAIVYFYSIQFLCLNPRSMKIIKHIFAALTVYLLVQNHTESFQFSINHFYVLIHKEVALH